VSFTVGAATRVRWRNLKGPAGVQRSPLVSPMERGATPVAETYQNDSVTLCESARGHAPFPSLLGRALVARVHTGALSPRPRY
jgi:hypothetical protein